MILPTTSAMTPSSAAASATTMTTAMRAQDQAVLDGGLALLVTAEALQHVLERDVELEHCKISPPPKLPCFETTRLSSADLTPCVGVE